MLFSAANVTLAQYMRFKIPYREKKMCAVKF